MHNPFARIHMPAEKGRKRLPIPIETIRKIQNACFEIDDDLRWLVALISDTGMRLSEAVGLAWMTSASTMRFINLRPHPWRRLKTQQSEKTPLVGAALGQLKGLLQKRKGVVLLTLHKCRTCNGTSKCCAEQMVEA